MKPPTEILESSIARDTVMARYHFNDSELAELGKKLASCRREERRIQEEFDSIKASYKSKQSNAELATDCVDAKITNGFEMLPTAAMVYFNHPEKGQKSAFREGNDGSAGEFLHTEPMTHADFQRPLFKDEKVSNEDLANSLAPAAPVEEPHPMPPTHLPEAHSPAPRATRKPFEQPPGTVDVNGRAEHWLVLDTEAPTTDAGLMAEFRGATKRAKWEDASISYVVERMTQHKDVTSKRAVLAEFAFGQSVKEGAE